MKGTLTFLGGPKLFHKLKLKIVDQNVERFLFAIFKQTVDYREANNFIRNDFMQLLIQLKNKGFISTSNDDDGYKKDNFTLNMNEITAQVIESQF
jgi:cytochrome P450 family 6